MSIILGVQLLVGANGAWVCFIACDELYNPTLKIAGAWEVGDVYKRGGIGGGGEGGLVSS